MKDGDCNIKFFHRAANGGRKFNAIQNVLVNAELRVEDSFVKSAIVHFHEKVYH